MKGLTLGIAMFMLIGLIVIISAWLFFIFFKVHITSIAVDVDSINRYQEIPTTLLGATIFVQDSLDQPATGPQSPDRRLTESGDMINCFNGNGPLGSHVQNKELCDKRLSFFFSKIVSGVGQKILDANIVRVNGIYSIKDFEEDLKLTLPISCYSVGIEDDMLSDESNTGCNLGSAKLDEKYPMPVFLDGEPTVIEQTIKIASSITTGEELLVTWPRYNSSKVSGLLPEGS